MAKEKLSESPEDRMAKYKEIGRKAQEIRSVYPNIFNFLKNENFEYSEKAKRANNDGTGSKEYFNEKVKNIEDIEYELLGGNRIPAMDYLKSCIDNYFDDGWRKDVQSIKTLAELSVELMKNDILD